MGGGGEEKGEGGGGGGWNDGDSDLDLDDDLAGLDLGDDDAAGGGDGAGGGAGYFVAPKAGAAVSTAWCNNSSIAADHAAAGSFDTAMQLLNRQIGVVNFGPLKKHFMAVYGAASCSLPLMPSSMSLPMSMQRTEGGAKESLPRIAITLESLVERLHAGYRAFSGGKFAECLATFTDIMQRTPLVVVNTRADAAQVKELLGLCREYTLAIRLQNGVLAEKEKAGGKISPRLVELAAYMTHCNLQPKHVLLTLKPAMTNAYKLKNMITAATFARRILELPESSAPAHAKTRTSAQKVLRASEANGRNEHQVRLTTVMCNNCGGVYVLHMSSNRERDVGNRWKLMDG
jgi:coatomer protein complex subunit alpha (xenin)